jgi:hypothetical protein
MGTPIFSAQSRFLLASSSFLWAFFRKRITLGGSVLILRESEVYNISLKVVKSCADCWCMVNGYVKNKRGIIELKIKVSEETGEAV